MPPRDHTLQVCNWSPEVIIAFLFPFCVQCSIVVVVDKLRAWLTSGPKTFSFHHFVFSPCVQNVFFFIFRLCAWPNWCRFGWVIRVYIKVWNYSGWNSIIECRCKRALSVAYSKWVSVSLLWFVHRLVRSFIRSRPQCIFFIFAHTFARSNPMDLQFYLHPNSASVLRKKYDNYYIISLVLRSGFRMVLICVVFFLPIVPSPSYRMHIWHIWVNCKYIYVLHGMTCAHRSQSARLVDFLSNFT